MLSAIITCKGRLAHLKQTLPSVLSQRIRQRLRVIVVDYADPDGCSAWIADRHDPRLWSVRVLNNTSVFNVSRARNIGARVARDPILAFLDADVVVDSTWLERASRLLMSGHAVASIPDWERPGFPACVVLARAYHAVRGFDESFQGWGYEEVDFANRISAVGRVAKFSSQLIDLIPYDSDLRTEFYRERDVRKSNRSNMARAARRRTAVNPLGYGGGTLRIYRSSPGISRT